MKNETDKQNFYHVACGYLDNIFRLGICHNSVSAKFRFCRATVSNRHSSDVDNASIQRYLIN